MYLKEIFEYKNERSFLFCKMAKAYIFVFNFSIRIHDEYYLVLRKNWTISLKIVG